MTLREMAYALGYGTAWVVGLILAVTGFYCALTFGFVFLKWAVTSTYDFATALFGVSLS